jgi:hypothetical protein
MVFANYKYHHKFKAINYYFMTGTFKSKTIRWIFWLNVCCTALALLLQLMRL